MRVLRSTWAQRGITAGLLFSLLPLLMSTYSLVPGERVVDRYAGWLKKRLGPDASEIVQQAIEKARTVEVHNLQAFLDAFFQVYGQVTADRLDEPASRVAFAAFVQSQYLALVGNATPPPAGVMKTFYVRTLISSKRIASAWFTLLRPLEVKLHEIGSPLPGGPPALQSMMDYFAAHHPRGP